MPLASSGSGLLAAAVADVQEGFAHDVAAGGAAVDGVAHGVQRELVDANAVGPHVPVRLSGRGQDAKLRQCFPQLVVGLAQPLVGAFDALSGLQRVGDGPGVAGKLVSSGDVVAHGERRRSAGSVDQALAFPVLHPVVSGPFPEIGRFRRQQDMVSGQDAGYGADEQLRFGFVHAGEGAGCFGHGDVPHAQPQRFKPEVLLVELTVAHDVEGRQGFPVHDVVVALDPGVSVGQVVSRGVEPSLQLQVYDCAPQVMVSHGLRRGILSGPVAGQALFGLADRGSDAVLAACDRADAPRQARQACRAWYRS